MAKDVPEIDILNIKQFSYLKELTKIQLKSLFKKIIFCQEYSQQSEKTILECCLGIKGDLNPKIPLYLIDKIFSSINKQLISYDSLQNISVKIIELILDNGDQLEENYTLLQSVLFL